MGSLEALREMWKRKSAPPQCLSRTGSGENKDFKTTPLENAEQNVIGSPPPLSRCE